MARRVSTTKLMLASVLFGAVLVCAGTATADSISWDADHCGSCEGLDLNLDITESGGTFTVLLTYTAPTGFTGEPHTSLIQAGFGAINKWDSISLDSVLLDGNDVSGDWSSAIASNISANGLCDGPAAGGKVCSSGRTDLAGGGELVFEYTVDGGKLKDIDEWHIGGQTGGTVSSLRGGAPGNVISESGQGSGGLIPEPSAALVFLVGTLVMGSATRRRS
jgi:hypothetical protein